MTEQQRRCEVCGDPFHGGARIYTDFEGNLRTACADEHACCDAFARNYDRRPSYRRNSK